MTDNLGRITLTPNLARVLRAFVAEPHAPRYGLEIMRHTLLGSGTVYPLLARLEKAGWISGATEDIDPHKEKRAPRRNYTLTDGGLAAARSALAELHELTRPPAIRCWECDTETNTS